MIFRCLQHRQQMSSVTEVHENEKEGYAKYKELVNKQHLRHIIMQKIEDYGIKIE